MLVRLRRITPIVYVGISQHRRFAGFPLASGAIGLFTGEEGIDENNRFTELISQPATPAI